MSFDIYFQSPPCITCGHSPGDDEHVANATHNINEMVEAVIKGAGLTHIQGREEGNAYPSRSWGRFSGWPVAEAVPHWRTMLDWFKEHEDELYVFNPPNGWGSTGCIHRVLTILLYKAAEAKPDRVVHTWG